MISETRRGFICGAAASVVTAGCQTALSPSWRKLLVYNEDNSAYACGRKFGGPPTEAGLSDYIRRWHNVGEYSLFADRMYRQGAPGIYLFNPFDNTPEVWKSLVSDGLPPSLVAMRAKGVTVTAEHD